MKPQPPTVTCPSCAAEIRYDNINTHMAWHQNPPHGEVVVEP